MSTPNPLIPQGTFQAQAAKGASNVRLAVATIVAIHIVFFGGLLLQGCKRDPDSASNGDTNAASTNLALPTLDSNAMFNPAYYQTGGLPPDAPTGAVAQGGQYGGTTPIVQPATQGTNPQELWNAQNLSTPGVQGIANTAATEGVGETKEYTIAKGDTLGAIAKRNNTTVSAIRKANPDVEPTRIRPGQKILVPVGTAAPASTGSSTNDDGSQIYTVKSGDTLSRIASRHGITVKQLSAANGLKTSRVNVGQKLKIPASTNAAPAPATGQPNQVF